MVEDDITLLHSLPEGPGGNTGVYNVKFHHITGSYFTHSNINTHSMHAIPTALSISYSTLGKITFNTSYTSSY